MSVDNQGREGDIGIVSFASVVIEKEQSFADFLEERIFLSRFEYLIFSQFQSDNSIVLLLEYFSHDTWSLRGRRETEEHIEFARLEECSHQGDIYFWFRDLLSDCHILLSYIIGGLAVGRERVCHMRH
jgi:hypothetical protein